MYDKGTRRQWVGSDRLDWSLEIDPMNPVGFPDEMHSLFGTPWWEKMTQKEKGEAKRHMEAWRFSQFMHGEQGALVCTAKIVQTVPDLDSKFYAATQVIDEAAPRGGVQPVPPREDPDDLPAEPEPAVVARRRRSATAVGT